MIDFCCHETQATAGPTNIEKDIYVERYQGVVHMYIYIIQMYTLIILIENLKICL